MPDRIIAATALSRNLPIITRDHKIQLSAFRPSGDVDSGSSVSALISTPNAQRPHCPAFPQRPTPLVSQRLTLNAQHFLPHHPKPPGILLPMMSMALYVIFLVPPR